MSAWGWPEALLPVVGGMKELGCRGIGAAPPQTDKGPALPFPATLRLLTEKSS